jgi:hypothetical protein
VSQFQKVFDLLKEFVEFEEPYLLDIKKKVHARFLFLVLIDIGGLILFRTTK